MIDRREGKARTVPDCARPLARLRKEQVCLPCLPSFAIMGKAGYASLRKVSGLIIDKQDVEHVALLARLELSEQEKEDYTRQLNSILGYMDKMNTLNTANVQPTAHVLPLNNVFREDTARPGIPREEALRNAPEQREGQFKVPRILGS